MRKLDDEFREVRVPSEAIARWALDAPKAAQEATYSALCFLSHLEHAAATLLPVPALLRSEQAVLDPDGFLRMPRGALEHFRLRSARAMVWMEQLVFFRERFAPAAQRQPPDALFGLAVTFANQGSPRDRAVDLLVREAVVPEIEDLLLRTLTYPPIRLLLGRIRETDPQRSADARRLAAEVVGALDGKSVWSVRRRLVVTSARALAGARPLLDELERGGFVVDRGRAAKGFARRLEEATSELRGTRVLPEALIARLVSGGAEKTPR
jgi:hypothetical protein